MAVLEVVVLVVTVLVELQLASRIPIASVARMNLVCFIIDLYLIDIVMNVQFTEMMGEKVIDLIHLINTLKSINSVGCVRHLF